MSLLSICLKFSQESNSKQVLRFPSPGGPVSSCDVQLLFSRQMFQWETRNVPFLAEDPVQPRTGAENCL